MEIRIEKMKMDDLDQVLEIEKSSFSSPWSRTAFEMELSGENRFAYYLVAREGCKVIGYLGAWLILNEAHITNIAVRPEYRKSGIGHKLMDSFFAQAAQKNIEAITLEVRVTNDPAQNLYRKLGFKDMGIRPKYYQDNQEDALIMWKVLHQEEC